MATPSVGPPAIIKRSTENVFVCARAISGTSNDKPKTPAANIGLALRLVRLDVYEVRRSITMITL